MKSSLSNTEELDFYYLLELMRPLNDTPEFALLPELFSILGHDKLLELCKYAGGEVVKLPTLEELADSIDALQWFYNVYIKHSDSISSVPSNLKSLVIKIRQVYYADTD